MDAKKLGAFISEIRKEQNMTQAELAKKISVTDKAVSRWERGVGLPDVSIFEPLAEALNISVIELIKAERHKEEVVSKTDAENIVSETISMISIDERKKINQTKLIIFPSLTILYFLIDGIIRYALIHSKYKDVADILYFLNVGYALFEIIIGVAFFIVDLKVLGYRYERDRTKNKLIFAVSVLAGMLLIFRFFPYDAYRDFQVRGLAFMYYHLTNVGILKENFIHIQNFAREYPLVVHTDWFWTFCLTEWTFLKGIEIFVVYEVCEFLPLKFPRKERKAT